MKELIKIQTELKAPKWNYNNFGKYKYRSAEDILEAVKPVLSKHNCYITISDDVIELSGRFYIQATATITNDKWESEDVVAYAREPEIKKGMDVSQITGSSSSYARKYALNGLFAIDDTKDADTMDNREQETKQVKQETKQVKQETKQVKQETNIDKTAKFEEMLKKNDPQTKEEFQKIQALFVKQYKGKWFTEAEKDKLGEIKHLCLDNMDK